MVHGSKRFRLKDYIAFFSITLLGVLCIVAFQNTYTQLGKNFVGFFFSDDLLVSVIQRAEWGGPKAGLKPLDKIVAVDNTPVENRRDIIRIVEKKRTGDTLIIEAQSNEGAAFYRIPVVSISFQDFLIGFLLPFSLGVIFLITGAISYFHRAQARGAFVFLMLCCAVCMFTVTLFEAHTESYLGRAFYIFPFISALTVHLFSLFPENALHKRRFRVLVLIYYVLAALLVVWKQADFRSSITSMYWTQIHFIYLVSALTMLAALLVRSYLLARQQKVKDKIRLLMVCLGIVSGSIAVWTIHFSRTATPFYLDEGIIFGAIFPVFLGYAIFRRNVFHLDRVIRSTLSYGLTAAIFVGLYFGSLGFLKLTILRDNNNPWSLNVVFFGFFLALMFEKSRQKVSHWVDQILFQSNVHKENGMERIEQILQKSMRLDLKCEQSCELLKQSFELGHAFIILFKDTSVFAGGVYGMDSNAKQQRVDQVENLFEEEKFEGLLMDQKFVDLSALNGEWEGLYHRSLTILRSLRTELVLSLSDNRRLLGVVCLSSKLSGERFDTGDIELLRRLQRSLSLILENQSLALRYSQKEKMAMLGHTSSVIIHDIKNPLAAIKISAGNIRRSRTADQTTIEMAEFIEEEVDRVNRTIGEILAFTRNIDDPKLNIDLNTVAKEIARRTLPIFLRQNVHLVLDLWEQPLPIQGAVHRIERAIENLLINAMEASDCQSTVTLFTSYSEGRAVIGVKDSGKGVPIEIRENIFDPFFTTKNGGTGLGLSIVQQVVREHTGELDLESSESGTLFKIKFPVHDQRVI